MAKTQHPPVGDDLAATRTGARIAVRRLAVWYGLVLVVFGVAWWLLSALPPSPGSDAADPMTGKGSLMTARDMLGRVNVASASWIEALLQMIAALLLTIPLAFVYVRTRTRVKFDHSLVQTVIVLPLGITAVLMMVRDSLALAFGLAGVVAAVRFRNNLKESGDAVYIFTAIAIGFAAGIQSLGIAVILSVLFCVLELALWYWHIAEPDGHQVRRICLGEVVDVVPPPSPFERVIARVRGEEPGLAAAVATPASAPAATNGDGTGAGGAHAGHERPHGDHGQAHDADERERRLRVAASDLIAAQTAIAAVLDEHAKRWALVRRDLGAGREGVLEYEVRLRKKEGAEALEARLRSAAGAAVRALQWRAGTAQTRA